MEHDLNQAALEILAKAAGVEVELRPSYAFDSGPRLKIVGTGGMFRPVEYWEPYAKMEEALAVVSGMAAGQDFRGWVLLLEFTGAAAFARMSLRNTAIKSISMERPSPALAICWACLDVIQNQADYLREKDEYSSRTADVEGQRLLDELAKEMGQSDDSGTDTPFS